MVVNGGSVMGPTMDQREERPVGEKSLVMEPTGGKVPPEVGTVEAIAVTVGTEKGKSEVEVKVAVEKGVEVGEEAVVLEGREPGVELLRAVPVSVLDKLAASI